MKISIIGIGRVGGALAIALAKNGYEIENLVGHLSPNVR
jgi:predicted dinucleotide-binding enzyme